MLNFLHFSPKMALTYTKTVSAREAAIYAIASANGIAPELLTTTAVDESARLIITTQLYLEVLIDVSNRDEIVFILAEARKLIQRLHQLGYLHGDLSEENIVYDRANRDVRIIDFGMSVALDTIKPESIPLRVENLYEGVRYAGPPSNDIDYLLRVELGILTFLEKSLSRPREIGSEVVELYSHKLGQNIFA